MSVTIDCSCGRSMTVRDELAGVIQRCIHCGIPVTRIDPPVEAPAPAPPPAAPPTPPFSPRPPVAWEDPARTWLSAWWRTWFASIVHPARFFEAIDYERGFRHAVTYVAVGVAQLLLAPLLLFSVTIVMMLINQTLLGRHYVEAFTLNMAAWIPAAILGTIAAVMVCAAVWHLCLRAVGGSGSFTATLRGAAYASGSIAIVILAIVSIPMASSARLYVGLIVPLILIGIFPLHLVLSLTTAFAKGHRIDGGRAFAAAVAPILFLALPAVLFTLAWTWFYYSRWRYAYYYDF